MVNQGWIKLHRKILDNPISKKPEYAWLWTTILLMANHDEKKFIFNGEEQTLKRGQILTGREKLSEQTGIKQTSIENILKYLEKNGNIGQQKTNKFRLITVNKYNEYQEIGQLGDNKVTTKRQQMDTNKNVKNVKNKNTTTEQANNYLQRWNEVFSTAYVSTKAIDGNLAYWLDSYKLEEILEAIGGIKKDKFWKDKDLSPEWLLRQKEKGEAVDRIGRMRENLKEDFSLGINFNSLNKK